MKKLADELREFLNARSVESGSNTPDFILADYLLGCLAAFEGAVNARDEWNSDAGKVPHGFARYSTSLKDETELDCWCGEHFPNQEALAEHVRGWGG